MPPRNCVVQRLKLPRKKNRGGPACLSRPRPRSASDQSGDREILASDRRTAGADRFAAPWSASHDLHRNLEAVDHPQGLRLGLLPRGRRRSCRLGGHHHVNAPKPGRGLPAAASAPEAPNTTAPSTNKGSENTTTPATNAPSGTNKRAETAPAAPSTTPETGTAPTKTKEELAAERKKVLEERRKALEEKKKKALEEREAARKAKEANTKPN